VSFSGGTAVTAAGVITATVPSCNRFIVGIPSLSASVKVDGGAWVSATQSTYTPTLAATPATHAVYVKTARKVYTTTSGTAMPVADCIVECVITASSDHILLTARDTGDYHSWTAIQFADGIVDFRPGGVGTYQSSGDLPVVGSRISLIADGTTSSWSIDGVVQNTQGNVNSAVTGAVSLTGLASGFQAIAIHPACVDYIDYSQTGTWARFGPALSVAQAGWSEHFAGTCGFATLNDKAYYSTAYNATRSFTGATTAVTASGSVTGGFMVEHKRRLFCAGAATDRALLNYTALDNGENWTGGGSIYLAGKDSGGECTGLAVWNNLLWYFSPSRTYSLDTTGVDTAWVARTISQSHGCIAPRSLVAAPNSLVFLAADGVRAYGLLPGINSADGSGFMLISENIAPTLAAFTPTQRAEASGAYYRNRYWLLIHGSIFVCDLEKRTKNGQPPWVAHKHIYTLNSLAVTRGDEYGLFTGCTDGNIYKLDTGLTDNGYPIDLMYETPPIAVGSYVTTKHFRSIDIAADGGNAAQSMTVTPFSDDIDGTAQTVVIDAASAVRPLHMQINARGRSLKLRITSRGLAQPLSISELTVRYTPPRMR
jgi:hypothetical protein